MGLQAKTWANYARHARVHACAKRRQQEAHDTKSRDVRPHLFVVPLNPLFRDQKFSLTNHFVADPATNSTKKREGHSAEMQNKKEN